MTRYRHLASDGSHNEVSVNPGGGTGKTTILTRKLIQNEQRVANDSVGIYEAENNQLREAEVVHGPDNNKPTILRQLFMTVSPQLCYAVKQHVSHLASNSSNGNLSAEKGLDVDVTSNEGKLSSEGYSMLAKSGSSTITEQKKEMIYKIFKAYEKKKTERGEFDLGDFVNDIHQRLRNEKYEGDQIDFVYIDKVQDLKPETSLISGEAPVFLESCNNENTIMTIFGGGKSGREIVGFGAEQVILVRDDRARNEIIEYVGSQALVLTILECKGLEF
nr:UvrD-like helicase, ATP-binding domain, P-loop containing nucleoside triphosphate hydrolase [Tanacetum cinerariifolium]